MPTAHGSENLSPANRHHRSIYLNHRRRRLLAAPPMLNPTATVPSGPYARINQITIENGRNIVEYETFEYQEALPGMHVHFFFDTVPPGQAGAPGAGPWFVWGGPRPFDRYGLSNRPGAATQMCALAANPNHSIILEAGNCVDLPEG